MLFSWKILRHLNGDLLKIPAKDIVLLKNYYITSWFGLTHSIVCCFLFSHMASLSLQTIFNILNQKQNPAK